MFLNHIFVYILLYQHDKFIKCFNDVRSIYPYIYADINTLKYDHSTNNKKTLLYDICFINIFDSKRVDDDKRYNAVILLLNAGADMHIVCEHYTPTTWSKGLIELKYYPSHNTTIAKTIYKYVKENSNKKDILNIFDHYSQKN